MVATTITAPRQRRSPDEVMQEVWERAPSVARHMYLDRQWIWFCGPSLAGDPNKETRQTLSAIGFRYSKKGHLMPDGSTIGTWGHSCERPMFRRRGSGPRRINHNRNPEEEDEKTTTDFAKAFAELGL